MRMVGGAAGWGLAAVLAAGSAAAWSQSASYVNFEHHPVRALALSPDRRLLAVAHTAEARVLFFDVTGPSPVPAGSVAVGYDPVAVNFRDDGELWVVNHVSDSVSIIDVANRRIRRTLLTEDEPADVVFANGRAFVSASQVNRVLVYTLTALDQPPQRVEILGEDPRALAVSPDGRTVYAAVYESGNATTILAGGRRDTLPALPNVVSDSRGPYGGQNPPPNRGNRLEPPLNPAAGAPPAVGLIVRRDGQGRWMDDNAGDWTRFVTGDLASASGRRTGWTLPDRDIAAIDASTLSVRYARGLMNIGMALGVKPTGGEVTLVGLESHNEIRFEPNLKGRFVSVMLARVAPASMTASALVDLNPHLPATPAPLPAAERARSLGEPRAIVWRSDGTRGWVVGMGSNNVVSIDGSGGRLGTPVEVGEGPAGLVLDEPRGRLYVWNHFAASVSQLALADGGASEQARVAVHHPLPPAIRAGRKFLYDTRLTSGSGHLSCASCHIDARMDRLAWDLGDPSQDKQRFDGNCLTTLVLPGQRTCEDWHGMKGPMTTQTLQDIIGHEPHHWRGDRAGIEAFNSTFPNLLGNQRGLTPAEMQAFEDYLATIHFPPNPNRPIDNQLPTRLPLPGHFSAGRFSPAGTPLPDGNAVRGLDLYVRGLLDSPFQCISCHTLPTGMAANGPLFAGLVAFPVGGSARPLGPKGENHLGIVSIDGSTNVSMKVPQTRNQHEKVGFELSQLENLAGFGFLHDGSVDSLARFFSAPAFAPRTDQDLADVVALTVAFAGSGFNVPNPNPLAAPSPPSKDAHAGFGAQEWLTSPTATARAQTMLTVARSRAQELIVREGSRGWLYDANSDSFRPDDGGAPLPVAALQARASASHPLLLMLVAPGLGTRLALDRDGDGVHDGIELAQGSHPADPASKTLTPRAGLWFNPARSGHGLDIQVAGEQLVVLWYTYGEDRRPLWYLASGPRAQPFRAQLDRYRWDPATGRANPSAAGELTLDFSDARRARFDWRLGEQSGSEPLQAFAIGEGLASPERTGTWFASSEPGWGLSVHTEGGVRATVLYFYDSDQQPRWALGSGAAADTRVELLGYSGFCPGCPHQAPATRPAGSLDLSLTDGGYTLRTDAYDPDRPGARWARGPVTLTALSSPVLRPERW